MGKFNLEQYFKDRVKGHKQEMDTDKIWNALNLDEDKNERGILFWVSSIVPVLLVGLIGWYCLGDVQNEGLSTNQIEVEQVDVGEKMINAEQSEIVVKNKIEESDLKTNLGTSNVKDISTTLSTRKEEISLKEELNQQRIKREPRTSIRGEIFESGVAENIRAAITEDHFEIMNQKDRGDRSLSTSSIQTNHKVFTETNFEKLPAMMYKLIADDRDQIELLSMEANPIVDNESPSHHFTMGIYGGYYLINRNLVSLTKQQNVWVDTRNTSEKTLEMISLGLDFSYELNDKWYLKSGVEFQSINEKFDWEQIQLDTIPVEGSLIQQYYSISGDTTNVYGSGLATENNSITYKYYNNHRLYNLPISIGRRFNIGNWSLFGEGSFIVNLSHRFSGHQIDEKISKIEVPNYYSTQLKFGVGGALGISYQVDPRVQLYTEAVYQKMLGSFINQEYGVKQSYEMYGLQLGLNYRLN